MSEQVEVEPKKKKGKLPVIIALVVVLAGGGFFVTKMRSPAKKGPEVIQLGAIEPLGTFLVNLSDGRTYLRADIAVHMAKGKSLAGGGGGHGGGDEGMAPVKDAIIRLLSSKSLGQVSTAEGKLALKRELAEALNHAVHEEPAEGKKPEVKPPDPVPEDWDSETGPVLKVYFTSFATQ